MYRKTTLRRMQPVTRHYARNLNSLQGILKRLQNLTQDIARLESDSTALFNRLNAEKADPGHTHIPASYDTLFAEDDQEEDACAPTE